MNSLWYVGNDHDVPAWIERWKGNTMILTVKKDKKLVAEFEDKGTVGKYECVVSACENPVCTCADVYIEFIPMPLKGQNGMHTPQRKVTIDIDEKRLNFRDKKSVSKEDMDFAELFFSKLDEKDYQILRTSHYFFKNEISEKTTPSSIEAIFDFHEVEYSGLMYGYTDILPFGDQIYVTLNDEKYIIFDQYCILPKCSCTDVNLQIIPIESHIKTKKELFTVSLNYRKKQWKLIDEKSTLIDAKSAIESIKKEIPDIYNLVRERHQKLKAIYAYNKKKHFSSDEKLQLPKVGRNDPCPCGSGKKYKKCCLGK